MQKLVLAVSAFGLVACGPLPLPEKFNIPMVTVLKMPDGTEMVMTGQIIPKMDYSAELAMASSSGVSCLGRTNTAGEGELTCDNGLPTLPFNIPRTLYGKPDGAFTAINNGVGTAVGWGKNADAAQLRAMF